MSKVLVAQVHGPEFRSQAAVKNVVHDGMCS